MNKRILKKMNTPFRINRLNDLGSLVKLKFFPKSFKPLMGEKMFYFFGSVNDALHISLADSRKALKKDLKTLKREAKELND